MKKKFRFFIWNKYFSFIASFFLVFIFICFILYVLLGILLYFNTDRFLYHPNNQDFFLCSQFENFTKESFNGTRFFYKDIGSNTTLVYYHGNGGTACDRSYLAERFDRLEVNLLFVEFSGYANDVKEPSKELLLNDVRNIEGFINVENISNVSVIGESLGTALASYHSTINDNVYSLILVAPFDSVYNVARNRYLKYYPIGFYTFDNYDNIKYLENYSKKLIIIHGSSDMNIPILHAVTLYEAVPTNDKVFIEYRGARHNDLYRYFDTYRAIRAGVQNESLEEFKFYEFRFSR